MKQTLILLKALSFLFSSLFVNSIYSQSACGAGYSFTSTNTSGCTYSFRPSFPNPHACIAYLTWTIGSSGTYKRTCERIVTDTLGLTYNFCFSGNHDITMVVKFCDSTLCYVTNTVNISCSGAVVCDPNPSRSDPIPDPVVDITYIKVDTCDFSRAQPISGCMSSPIGNGNYYVACGWKWAIRIPPSSYNCTFFSYGVQWTDATGCDSVCSWAPLDTNILCIIAKVNKPIYIVATANHCCLPNLYQRGYVWTPVPSSSYSTISDPSNIISNTCTAYRNCPSYTYCVENPQTMNQTSGWPATHCFAGGKKVEQRELGDNGLIRQYVIIYNIQGMEVFKGEWKFGDQNNLNLNWPNNLRSGIYFVKFQNSEKLAKLYKFE